ncbi:MAG: hypothetical protein RJA09_1654 [Pseudomonadota bacterium]
MSSRGLFLRSDLANNLSSFFFFLASSFCRFSYP